MPEPAAFAWLTIIFLLLAFEGWAVATHNLTLSQWIQGWAKIYPWIKPVGIGSLLGLIYHLFF